MKVRRNSGNERAKVARICSRSCRIDSRVWTKNPGLVRPCLCSHLRLTHLLDPVVEVRRVLHALANVHKYA